MGARTCYTRSIQCTSRVWAESGYCANITKAQSINFLLVPLQCVVLLCIVVVPVCAGEKSNHKDVSPRVASNNSQACFLSFLCNIYETVVNNGAYSSFFSAVSILILTPEIPFQKEHFEQYQNEFIINKYGHYDMFKSKFWSLWYMIFVLSSW